MAEKAAAQSMIGDVGRFQQVAMGEAMASGRGGGAAADMAGIAMGMSMGQQMAANLQQGQQTASAESTGGPAPNFCPDCGTKTNGAKFCPNCGRKLI